MTWNWVLSLSVVMVMSMMMAYIPVQNGQEYWTMAHDIKSSAWSDMNRDDTGYVKMYLHEVSSTYTMNTTKVVKTNPQTTIQLDDSSSTPIPQSVTFSADKAFLDDVEVQGDDLPGAPNKGIWVRTHTAYIGISGTAKVHAVLYSDSTMVASGTVTVGVGSPENDYKLEFTTGIDKYIFKKNSVMKLAFNVSVNGNGMVLLYIDGDDPDDSHISLKTEFVSSTTVGTYDRDGIVTKEFQPNLPAKDSKGDDLRVMVIKGVAKDRYYYSDISSISVEVKSPGGSVLLSPTEADMQPGSDDATISYEYRWTYPRGLQGGDNYIVNVYVSDASGNNHTTTSTFSMAKYGVYILADEPNHAVAVGDSSSFDVIVYNSGASYDKYTIEASIFETIPTNDDWKVKFEGADSASMDTALAAGQSKKVTIVVSAPDSAKENDKATIKISAASQNDASSKYTSYLTITATAKISVMVSTDSTSKSTIAGKSVDYKLTVRNVGTIGAMFGIRVVEDIPGDWSADFSSSDVDLKTDDNYTVAYDFYLDCNAKSDITFTVQPPKSPTDDNAVAILTVQVFALEKTDMHVDTKFTTTVPTAQGTNWAYFTSDEGKSTGTLHNHTISYSTVRMTMQIENNGYYSFNATIRNTPSSETSAWDISLSKSTVTIYPGMKESIYVDITPDSTTLANTDKGYPVKFQVVNDLTGATRDISCSIKVNKLYAIKTEIMSSDNYILKSYDSAEYQIKITNLGNTKDTIEMSSYLEPSDGWKLTVDGDSKVTLDPDQSRTFTIKIKPDPAKVDNGDSVKAIITFKYANGEQTDKKTILSTELQLGTIENLTHAASSLLIQIFLLLLFVALVIYARVSNTA